MSVGVGDKYACCAKAPMLRNIWTYCSDDRVYSVSVLYREPRGVFMGAQALSGIVCVLDERSSAPDWADQEGMWCTALELKQLFAIDNKITLQNITWHM